MKYAMFLRGINVGGIKVPMAELRQCLSELGLQDIQTYLQTGNVVFESSDSIETLKPRIEQALSQRFNYTAFILVYSFSEFADIVANYPLTAADSDHRYVVLCETDAVAQELASFKDELNVATEDIAVGKMAVYWRVPKGNTLDSQFGKILAQPKYKSVTTNRNINTLEKMIS